MRRMTDSRRQGVSVTNSRRTRPVFPAAIAAAIALTSAVTIASASTDVSASARSASPNAWACGDDSPSRRDALELEEWWRGLEINELELGVGRSQIRIRSSKF